MGISWTSTPIPKSPDTVAAASGGTPSRRPVSSGSGSRSKDRGSTITMEHGVRQMKAYPITEGEMAQLFWMGLVATLCFSVAAGLIGFTVNIQQAISFAQGTPTRVIDFWMTLQGVAVVISFVLIVVGCLLLFFGRTRRNQIKSETVFQNK